MLKVSPARPQPCSVLMPPPSVYITVSRSGQTRRPNKVMSSPVFPTTVISASGAARFRPRRKRAAPTPPASTVMRITVSVAGFVGLHGARPARPARLRSGPCLPSAWDPRLRSGLPVSPSALLAESDHRLRCVPSGDDATYFSVFSESFISHLGQRGDHYHLFRLT